MTSKRIRHELIFLSDLVFLVLCGMLMTACDVSAIAKPWEQQHLLAKRVADEFFDQGDLEKARLNTQPIVSGLMFWAQIFMRPAKELAQE